MLRLRGGLEWHCVLALLAQILAFSLFARLLFLECMLVLRVYGPKSAFALLIWTSFHLLECTARGKVMPNGALRTASVTVGRDGRLRAHLPVFIAVPVPLVCLLNPATYFL